MPPIPADYAEKAKRLLEIGHARIDRAGQLRFTEISGRQPNSFAGNLHPAFLEKCNDVSGMAQNLKALTSLSEFTAVASGIAAAAGVINIGVSVAGFAIVCKKLNKMQARIDAISDKIDQLPSVIRQENQRLFDKLVENKFNENCAKILGLNQALQIAQNSQEPSTVPDVVLVHALEAREYFRQVTHEAVRTHHVSLAQAAYGASLLALSAAVLALVVKKEPKALLSLRGTWISQILNDRQKLVSQLLGSSPGILRWSENPEIFQLAVPGIEPADLSIRAATDRINQAYKADKTNSTLLCLVDSSGNVEIVPPGAITERDAHLLGTNFEAVAKLTSISSCRIDELEYAPFKSQNLANVKSDDLVEFIDIRVGNA
jgi:hypothetical protein